MWFNILSYLKGYHGKYLWLKGGLINMGLSTERYSLWKVALGAIVFEYKDLINKYLEKDLKLN